LSEPRIVSLIASATEIVCALGCRQQLVGRSHECDFPPSVSELPICTEPKLDPGGTSREIDQAVKRLVADGLSVYRVHGEKLRELRPDVIVTQDQCEVCAVSLRDVEQALCTWLHGRPQLVSLKPNCLADVWENIRHVSKILGGSARGDELAERLRSRMGVIEEENRALPGSPTVACIEWINPLMAAGNWMPELVEMAGGTNLFGSAGLHSPRMTWEEVVKKDPEVILVLPCGLDMERTRREMPALTEKPEWDKLQAVRNRRVYLADGNQYFNRPGPRLVESLEILAQVLHPSAFRFGHEHTGWELF